MSDPIAVDAFLNPLFNLWEEVLGEPPRSEGPTAVLDLATGWAPSLSALTAAQASRPVVPGGTTIAGQTAHAAYYLELFEDIVLNRQTQADWPGSFAPSQVDEAAWAAQQARLFGVADRVAALMRSNPSWPETHVRGALGSLVHLAYHLGAVRQMARAVAELPGG
jgi:hypothetical protein